MGGYIWPGYTSELGRCALYHIGNCFGVVRLCSCGFDLEGVHLTWVYVHFTISDTALVLLGICALYHIGNYFGVVGLCSSGFTWQGGTSYLQIISSYSLSENCVILHLVWTLYHVVGGMSACIWEWVTKSALVSPHNMSSWTLTNLCRLLCVVSAHNVNCSVLLLLFHVSVFYLWLYIHNYRWTTTTLYSGKKKNNNNNT